MDKLYFRALLTALLLIAARVAFAEPAAPNSQMKAVLDELAALSPQPIETLSPEEARKQPTPTDAVKALLKSQDKSSDPEPVAEVDHRKVESPDGRNIPVRIYTPRGEGPFPVIVYYHGGGFVIADLDTYDASCRALCNGARAVVVSVDYRRAPEHKFPAAVDDAYGAYIWVRHNAAKINGDPAKVAVAEESAGGNLATVVSLMAKEQSAALPTFQLLMYPLVDNDMNRESYVENADSKPLNRAMMGWFMKHYLSDPTSANDPHVCPFKAKDMTGLPPAMVITAQIDPLRSEGKAYADKLKAAGVEVQYKNYDGVTHEFFGMAAVVDVAKQAQSDASAALAQAFAGRLPGISKTE
jgi:acetyl esterase